MKHPSYCCQKCGELIGWLGRAMPFHKCKEKTMDENKYGFIKLPEQSRWTCYMFGNRPGGMGIVYTPRLGNEPNWFARWMMRVCFDCLWVKEKP